MMYENIERKRNFTKSTVVGCFIFLYVMRFLIHVSVPVLFFSVFNNFINNTEEFFNSSTTETSISYDRMFYIFILLQNAFVGILDVFPIFMKTTSKNGAIISSGSTLYSCLIAFFYLILFYSFSDTERTYLNFFQYMGFLEILSIVIWVFLIGMYIIEAILNRSFKVYKGTTTYQDNLLNVDT